jgi:integrase
MLTALRRNEVGHARWREFDLIDKKEWTIPASRMKADAAHVVPLTRQMIALVDTLPRTSEFVFPNRLGVRPLAGHSTLKAKLDGLMLEELQREDPSVTKLDHFTLHDIRRSVRTHLSMLPVPGGDLVRELILAHTKPGLHKVYDQHAYLDEKRRALELWQEKLTSILGARSADIIPLAQRGRP